MNVEMRVLRSLVPQHVVLAGGRKKQMVRTERERETVVQSTFLFMSHIPYIWSWSYR